jgi:GNAT superfamily N-acetyltransferase
MADVSVRAARAEDGADIANIQAAAWRQAYDGVLPADALAALGDGAAEEQWQAAAEAPPSPRHHVLVAVAGPDPVGFAAVGPAEDDDLDTGSTAELSALSVAPTHTGEGHGSRLVNAAVDHLRQDGFARVVVWVMDQAAADEALERFLAAAGWAPDGARRTLDLHGDGSVLVSQHRLAVTITADP